MLWTTDRTAQGRDDMHLKDEEDFPKRGRGREERPAAQVHTKHSMCRASRTAGTTRGTSIVD